ncbi:glycoside hydrolase family protein [Escherichia coli]|nr:glycoside hydrolase family protein [Escherichia coli]
MIGVLMLAINWYYKHKAYQLLRDGQITGRTMNPSIVKRCLVGTVLAIAATLPGFQQLHTSVEGLKLIADYEGCRLQPYQCSAGVWTDGIGNTSGRHSRQNHYGTTGSKKGLSPTCCVWSGRWKDV